MKTLLRTLLGLLLLLPAMSLLGQDPAVSTTLVVSDGDNSRDLTTGIDPAALEGLDPFDGASLPPLPPGFEARLIGNDIGKALGEGVYTDIRPCPAGGTDCESFSADVDYELLFKLGTGSQIEVSWNLPASMTGTLVDRFGGVLFGPEPMVGTGSFMIPNNGGGAPVDDRAIVTVSYNMVSLPIELGAFDARSNEDGIALTWETLTETDNAGFEIEMARDEAAFETVGYVSGNGTTTERSTYSFLIPDSEAGHYAIRLKQIDFNGQFTYHPAVEVERSLATRFDLQPAYPNPFNPTTQIRFASSEDEVVSVQLIDMTGRVVATPFQQQVQANRYNEVRVDAASLPGGIYLVRARGAEFSATQMITLVK